MFTNFFKKCICRKLLKLYSMYMLDLHSIFPYDFRHAMHNKGQTVCVTEVNSPLKTIDGHSGY